MYPAETLYRILAANPWLYFVNPPLWTMVLMQGPGGGRTDPPHKPGQFSAETGGSNSSA